MLNSSILSQCTYRCVVLPDLISEEAYGDRDHWSQCTYRCVVLPDTHVDESWTWNANVSMHLQVRGAP